MWLCVIESHECGHIWEEKETPEGVSNLNYLLRIKGHCGV
jgi:hypothetical protein